MKRDNWNDGNQCASFTGVHLPFEIDEHVCYVNPNNVRSHGKKTPECFFAGGAASPDRHRLPRNSHCNPHGKKCPRSTLDFGPSALAAAAAGESPTMDTSEDGDVAAGGNGSAKKTKNLLQRMKTPLVGRNKKKGQHLGLDDDGWD